MEIRLHKVEFHQDIEQRLLTVDKFINNISSISFIKPTRKKASRCYRLDKPISGSCLREHRMIDNQLPIGSFYGKKWFFFAVSAKKWVGKRHPFLFTTELLLIRPSRVKIFLAKTLSEPDRYFCTIGASKLVNLYCNRHVLMNLDLVKT